MYLRLTILLLLTCLGARGEIIPAGRMPVGGWTNVAGMEGGIPDSSTMTVYSTVPQTTTLSNLNWVIDHCPSNQVVELAAGTYHFGKQFFSADGRYHGIFFNGKSGVVLRGQGSSTRLVFTSDPFWANIFVQGSANSVVWDGPDYVVNWTNGYTAGTSNIMLSSTSGLSVGTIICLDQLNDENDVTKKAYETTGTNTPGCYYGVGCNDCSRNCGIRIQVQFTEVKAITSNTVTIWPPLMMPNWQSSQDPEAWWFQAPSAKRCGIENLAIDGTASAPGGGGYAANITFWNAWNCWVKDVYSTNNFTGAGGSVHIHMQQSGRCEIRHNKAYGCKNTQSMTYGIFPNMCSSSLIVDNIVEHLYGLILLDYACMGNVVAYNYCPDPENGTSSMGGSFWFHGGHECMNLIEGNFGTAVFADDFHGSQGYNTVFRNRLPGNDPQLNEPWPNQRWAIDIEVFSRYWSVVGNVLGTPGVHTIQDTFCTGTYNDPAIYKLGWARSNGNGITNDPVVVSTFYRHGNYDVVANSVVWNPTNSDHSLPESLFEPSKPTWFGDRPWPPFDPTNGAALAANSMAFTNIPAGYRYIYGVDPSAAPNISTQPQSRTVVAGSNVVFSVTLNGTSPFAYQWTFDGEEIADATSSSYTIAETQETDEGDYAVVVTNTYGSITSSAATLTVYTEPFVTVHPADTVMYIEHDGLLQVIPSNVVFTIEALGTNPLSYAWYVITNGEYIYYSTWIESLGYEIFDNDLTNIFIISRTNSSPIWTNVSYCCIITNSSGSVTSSAAALTADDALTLISSKMYLGAPKINDLISTIGNTYSGTTSNSINPGGGTNVITACRYQATNTFEVNKIEARLRSSTGSWKCAIYGGSFSYPSNLLAQSSIVSNNSTGWRTFNLTTNLTVTNANYYWIAIWCNASTALYSRMYYSSSSVPVARQVRAFGAWPTNFGAATISSTNYCMYAHYVGAPLVFEDLRRIGTATPGGPCTNIEGQSITISNIVWGDTPAYQWRKNETNILAGETNANLYLRSLEITNSGTYSCIITNIHGAITTAPSEEYMIDGELEVIDAGDFKIIP